MSIQDGDKFLVGRNNSPYSIDSENLVANIEDTDLMLVTRNSIPYRVTGEEVKASLGGGGNNINPSPDDISADPALDGSGTADDPFVLPSSSAAPAGQTAASQQFTISGQTPNADVVFENQSNSTRTTGNRFNQPAGKTDGNGDWTGSLQYADTPNSTEDTTYVGKFKIGTVYLQWTVQQSITSSVAPVLTSVSLVESKPSEDPRFTDQSFVASASLSEEGTPVSTKTFDAFVEGKITTKEKFEEPLESSVVNAGTNATFSNQFAAPVPNFQQQAFNGQLNNWATPSTGNVITWLASGAMSTQTFNKVEIYSYGSGEVEVTYAGGTKSTAGPGGTDQQWIAVDGPFTNITQVKLTDTQNTSLWAALRIDGEILIDDQVFGESTQLNFASDADMEHLASGDAVSGDSGATGTVGSKDGTTVTLSASSGTWVNGEDVTGPEKTVVLESAKKYLEFNQAGTVEGLRDTPQSPAWKTDTSNPQLTLTFPAKFPSGNTPDEELGEGTELTVEVTASNAAGSSGPKSDKVQPEGTPTPQPDPTDVDKAKKGLVKLYSGNATAGRKITTGIDIKNDGGLIWIKNKTGTNPHCLTDTINGPSQYLQSNDSGPLGGTGFTILSFEEDGWTMGLDAVVNGAGDKGEYVAWSFPKTTAYFDVVEFTGNSDGTEGQTQVVPHNLGRVPGLMLIKSATSNDNWNVYHKDAGNTHYGRLQLDVAFAPSERTFNNTSPTESNFTVGWNPAINKSGDKFVAYLFAEDTPDLIKCGGFASTFPTNNTIVTGFKPQWIMIKATSTSGNWRIWNDKMVGPGPEELYANSNTSVQQGSAMTYNSDGFSVSVPAGDYVYVAIAAPPPPATPVDALKGLTKVYDGTNAAQTQVTGIDLANNAGLIWFKSTNNTAAHNLYDTLRGGRNVIQTNNGNNQTYVGPDYGVTFNDNGWSFNGGNYGGENAANTNNVAWSFQKAEGYFDVVEYTGIGTSNPNTVPHSLGTKPGLILVKNLSANTYWMAYHSSLGIDKLLYLNTSDEVTAFASDYWGNVEPTDTDFTVQNSTGLNATDNQYVAYLFAENVKGVIQCGSYTGAPGDKSIVTPGMTPQWVMIKCTSSGGTNWAIYDSKRADTKELRPNTTSAQQDGGPVVMYSSGFAIGGDDISLNSNGASYIYVAIAAPPSTRSLTQAEFAEQALKFATYQNRKEVIEGQNAMSKRDDLMQELKEAGASQEQIDNLMS